MRDIRFRAWDGERMITGSDCHDWGVSLVLTLEGDLLDIFCDRHELEGAVNDRHVLLQYTGLKDKSGVEIYEGDICREVIFACPGCETQYEIGVVTFECGAYVFNGFPLYPHEDEDVEVIGNIYENGELVEGDE